jgi:hypothetical protein
MQCTHMLEKPVELRSLKYKNTSPIIESCSRQPSCSAPVNYADRFSKPLESWMWEHTRDVHEGQIGDNGGVIDYKFTVSSTFKGC